MKPPTRHDKQRFNLGGKAPRCPLCLNFMEKMWHPIRQLFIFKCDTPGSCGVALRVDDPFVGRWDRALEKAGGIVPCPNPRCPKFPDGPMRFFATMVGFVKGYCPACHATISNKEPDRKTDEPQKLYTPDAPPAAPTEGNA